jgi:hypothetical protein
MDTVMLGVGVILWGAIFVQVAGFFYLMYRFAKNKNQAKALKESK